jgi:hypothetical protein
MLANEPLTQRYEFRPDVVATVLDDGAVLLDLETKYFYRLNGAGWAIAQLFESGATLHDVQAYCQSLNAKESDAPAVTALIEALLRDNLIEPSGSGPAVQSEPAVKIAWSTPTMEKQAEPLQRVIISAFDPSVPLVE